MEEVTKKITFNGEELVFKTNKLAPRAGSAIWAQIGETVVLTVVSMSSGQSSLNYFPLGVEYLEKMYAGGKISGSRFLKRDGRPSDDAVLKARQVDHSIRSLFPNGFKREVNVIINVLAYDGVHDPETLAVTSASMALMNSDIPFDGPSASVVVGVKGEELILNPVDTEEMHESLDGEFIVSLREDRVLNIEGWGKSIPEEKMKEVLEFAQEKSRPLIEVQKEFQKEVGKEKIVFEAPEEQVELQKMMADKYATQISEALYHPEDRQSLLEAIQNEYVESLGEDSEVNSGDVMEAIEYVAKKIMRNGILESEKRTSGRKLDEVRDLSIEVGVLPRVHGSSIFSRGKTQCMAITTLASTRLAQSSENYKGEGEKAFMHHYSGPNYSFGQAGRFNYYAGRREIGHGNIGESALKQMLPNNTDFPYTIRVASEILSQMGSSSMAATCAASLSLMDAGVPLKKHVGGISVGLVTADDDLNTYKLLTDMEDVEDFFGDMDFKVTGTTEGVTSIQLDNKLMGVPVSILKEAFDAARKARMFIIEEMTKVISEPRAELSEYAPKVDIIRISPEKIGDLIGPGGKTIKAIMEKAGEGLDIDIQDDGQVNITAISKAQRDIAVNEIEGIVAEPEVGRTYTGTVAKIMDFGFFVDVTKSISGLVHVSEMTDGFVKDPNDLVKTGDVVKVKLKEFKDGKQSYTMKGVAQD